MSNNKFTVDAVPTPRINLAGAFESDLGYYMKNGNRLPPLGKSQLKQLEEQLNDYLKFLNESFILKGFTKGALTVSVINAGLIQDKEGKFVIDLDNSTWVLYDDKKENVLFSYSPQTGLMLSGKLFAEEGTIGGFTIGKEQLKSRDGSLVLDSKSGKIKLGGLELRRDSYGIPELANPSGELLLWGANGVYLGGASISTFYADDDKVSVSNLYVDGKKYTPGSGMSQSGEGYTTGSNVKMRSYPSTSAPTTYTIRAAYSDVAIFGRGDTEDGYTWYFCRYDEDYIGWIREDLLSVVMG